MRLTDILQADCIKVPLESSSKQAVIYELVELLSDKHQILAVDELKAAVWERETTRTTGIGHSIAIPHGKTRGCPRLCMAIGKPVQPVEFGAIDGRPVQLVILLASPTDQTGPHIQALARISQMLTQESIRSAMMRATSAEEIYAMVSKFEPAN